MIDPADIKDFLAGTRIAVVGASDNPKSFARTIYRELREHGYEPVAVNPNASRVDGDVCYPDLRSVPGELDGVLVMINRDRTSSVVNACIDRGVPRVWLFKGIGGASAVDERAVELCRQHGIRVIAGACPMMFLEPVGGAHRFHRMIRRLNHSLAKTA
jgi:predicted CoA-binding protein